MSDQQKEYAQPTLVVKAFSQRDAITVSDPDGEKPDYLVDFKDLLKK